MIKLNKDEMIQFKNCSSYKAIVSLIVLAVESMILSLKSKCAGDPHYSTLYSAQSAAFLRAAFCVEGRLLGSVTLSDSANDFILSILKDRTVQDAVSLLIITTNNLKEFWLEFPKN